MKRIVIIDHFSKAPNEPGNNRFIYLGELLCDYGYDVEIITTTFAHLKKKQRKTNVKLYDDFPLQIYDATRTGISPKCVFEAILQSLHIWKKLVKLSGKHEKTRCDYSGCPVLRCWNSNWELL